MKALPVQTGNYPQIALQIVLSVVRAYGAANGLSLKAERLEDIQVLAEKAVTTPAQGTVHAPLALPAEEMVPAEVAAPAKKMTAPVPENEVGVPEAVTAPVMATAPPVERKNVRCSPRFQCRNSH